MPWKELPIVNLRFDFVTRSFSKDQTFSELCREFGISTKTGYKWKERFIQEGIEGLSDKSRRPKGSPKKLSEAVLCEIIKIKNTKQYWGPGKIRDVYALNHPREYLPCKSTFSRILQAAGFTTRKRRRKYQIVERIQNRIQPHAPNQLWTVDFKGWWYTPNREKCEPLTVRDEYSKYILSIKILKKGDIASVKNEFERLFKLYGLPKVIRSDNGPPFASSNAILGLTKLAVWWISLGIQLDRIDPGSPYQNGAHERMHKDIKTELEHKINGNLRFHQHIFDIWRVEFNTERPHEALAGKTPASIYHKSTTKYHGTDYEIPYPRSFRVRKIDDRGSLHYKGHRIFISNAFAAQYVGLELKGRSVIKVHFASILIGVFDLKFYIFKSILGYAGRQKCG
jgi:transposase InsO family protein